MSSEETNNFDRLTAKGRDGGLFRAAMKAIRSPHIESNKVRLMLTIAGLFTDKQVYREVIAIFYMLTKELEAKLEGNKNDPICQKLLTLGYRFTAGYEADLQFLYGTDWNVKIVDSLKSNAAAIEYYSMLQAMKTGSQLAGATFVLWGALIIGGGAIAQPRVASAFGKEATHLFEDVTGAGREQRKRAFVEAYDSLAEEGAPEFDEIVASTKRCMQGNNSILGTIPRKPWWFAYAVGAGCGMIGVVVYVVFRKIQKTG